MSHRSDEGACDVPPTLEEIDNPPGQPSLRYRIGTWSTFDEVMRARLSRFALDDGSRPLQALTTRDLDDPSIALLDAFACVADVLTFYQERLANEGFLRTATERLSVLELSRAIGYTPNPGVAASAWLAFTLDDSERAPETVEIPVGLQVNSVPGPGELPQTFETVQATTGRPAFNAMRPRQTRPQEVGIGTGELWLAAGARIARGDALLVIGEERAGGSSGGRERWDFRFVTAVTPESSLLRVTLDRGLGWQRYGRRIEPASAPREVHVFRGVTPLFGHNAPAFSTLNPETQAALAGDGATSWPGFDLGAEAGATPPTLDLDGRHTKIVAGSWVVLVDGEYAEVARVEDTSLGTRSDFLVTGPYTRLTLDEATHNVEDFDRRTTVAWIQSEALEGGEAPIVDAVDDDVIELDRLVDGLVAGRTLVLVGTLVDGTPGAETAVIAGVRTSEDGLCTVLDLEAPLAGTYDRADLTVHGNVVLATHGETHAAQVLGSGDAGARFQRFALRRSPLTHVSAPTPSGGESTLEVRVNGVLWEPLATLYGQEPTTEGYVVDIDDAAVATVRFGDGVTGARLPTGTENVLATYRTGIGAGGNVGARSLTLLKTRPLGLRQVDNPMAATGGTDAETRDEARDHAPLTVLTLDRLVSRSDFEDFARAYAGVAKARAVEVWNGERREVHLTAVGEGGVTLVAGDPTRDNLAMAIDAQRDPTQAWSLGPHRSATFRLAAEVRVDPRHVAETVLAEAEAALREAFAFSARALGQAVTASEVLLVLHGVAGVEAVDLNALYRPDAGEPDPDDPERTLEDAWLAAVLVAGDATWQGTALVGAELLLLDDADDAVLLEEMP